LSVPLLGTPLVVFAGSGSGRGGEDGLGFVGPTGTDKVPLSDDERGLVLLVGEQVGLEGSQVQRPALGGLSR